MNGSGQDSWFGSAERQRLRETAHDRDDAGGRPSGDIRTEVRGLLIVFAIAGHLFAAPRFPERPDPYEENTPAVVGVTDYDSTLRAERAALARTHA